LTFARRSPVCISTSPSNSAVRLHDVHARRREEYADALIREISRLLLLAQEASIAPTRTMN
jgi:hypothetical protein